MTVVERERDYDYIIWSLNRQKLKVLSEGSSILFSHKIYDWPSITINVLSSRYELEVK
jgi:hypothetical protein